MGRGGVPLTANAIIATVDLAHAVANPGVERFTGFVHRPMSCFTLGYQLPSTVSALPAQSSAAQAWHLGKTAVRHKGGSNNACNSLEVACDDEESRHRRGYTPSPKIMRPLRFVNVSCGGALIPHSRRRPRSRLFPRCSRAMGWTCGGKDG